MFAAKENTKGAVNLVRIFWLIFILGLKLLACEERVFDLYLEDSSVSIKEVLSEFSKECAFSVVYDDTLVEERLNKTLPMVNVKKKDLSYLFDLLFGVANLHYDYHKGILKLLVFKTQTFKINYLSTNRQGTSSTSVAINYEEKGTNYETSGKATQSTSKSGVDITSTDGFNFWETIKQEILALLNLPPDMENPNVIINKGAGLVSVKGDRKSLKEIEAYLQKLHKRLQKQVLIDVHILSVQHKDSQTIGIDWESLYDLQNVLLAAPTSQSNSFGKEGEAGNVSGLSYRYDQGKSEFMYGINIFSQGLSLNRIVEFLKTYGEVQSISNPKVLTLNNQPALISVGDILRYKKTSVYQNTNSQTTLTNTDDEYPSIFAGVLLDITPLVFDEEIMLKINPSITKTKENQVDLPSNAFDTPPNLMTNQLSSIVKVKNNQKVILGGLISQSLTQKENKIPLLGDIPLIKPLFSYSQNLKSIEEIVFIIEPKIIEDWAVSLEDLGYHLIQEEDI